MIRRFSVSAAVLLVLVAVTGPRAFGDSGLPVPRFVSLGAEQINLRKGPGRQYPIEWVYRRKGMPVEVTAEYDVWRRIRDHENTTGWVHGSLLSGRRTALVLGAVHPLHRGPSENEGAVALLEPGVVGRVRSCRKDWCELAVGGHRGWLQRAYLWGVYPGEEID